MESGLPQSTSNPNPYGPGNPYDFITASGKNIKPPKQGMSNQMQRIIFVLVGAIFLVIVGMVVSSVLSSSGKEGLQNIVDISAKQTEILRISDQGSQKARANTAKNLAATTSISLKTSQTEINKLLAAKGIKKLTTAQAASAKSKADDEALTLADQNNSYDSTFIEIMLKDMRKYQTSLKKAYDASSSAGEKKILDQQFQNITLIIEAQAAKN